MKVTNEQIANTKEALVALASMTFPVKVSLAIQELIQQLDPAMERFVAVQNQLVTKYGDTQESGELAVIFPDDAIGRPVSKGHAKFTTEFTELLQTEVELKKQEIIVLPFKVDGKPLQISAALLIVLKKFVKIG